MKTPLDINKKVDETLESLDGIRRAEPLPFLYTRVIGRLQRDKASVWEQTGSFLSKPVVVISGLCFILVFNAFLLLGEGGNKEVTAGNGSTEVISTDNEYVLASNSSFDYENLDQQ